MHSTGIVKKIDNLGRIVLPKEIRKKLKIRENDEFEIMLEKDESIVLKKYLAMNDLKKDCSIYAELLNKELGFKILFTDKEKVIVASGKNTALLVGEEISEELLKVIENRMVYNINKTTNFKVLNTEELLNPKAIYPIIVDSKSIGALVVFLDDNENRGLKEKDYELLKFIVSLITLKSEI